MDRHHDVNAAWARLERAGWLAGRSTHVRELLRGVARPRHYAAGTVIYRAGDTADGVYGLVDGSLDVTIPRADGEEFVIHRADPGFWVGDLALFSNDQRLIGLQTVTPCQLVHLSGTALKALAERYPTLIADFYQLSHQNMTVALRLLGNLALPGAENRVALRLYLHCQGATGDDEWVYISQPALAQMVALSEQSVRRALHSLERQGIIEIGYGKVRIIDRDGLAVAYRPALHPRARLAQ